MISQKFGDRVLFNALEKTKFGRVRLTIQSPLSTYEFGDGPEVAKISIKSSNVLRHIAKGGDVELASAVIRKDIQISDEAAFIEWACKNDDRLKETFYGKFLGTLLPRLQRIFRPNTVAGAKRNIMEHYDLGNDFYSKWLDPSMSYSSALFKSDSATGDLMAAQNRKYDRIIDELEISANDRVLEVGCGWGGFFSRAIQRTGCHVTAVLNSPLQAAYDRELIQKKGLGSHVQLHQIDYRQIQGKFDKIVSIEMIEAVGRKYWPTYFEKLATSLHAGGRAMIQSITIRENRFDEYCRNPDFISTMIFPGGMLLTNKAIAENAEHAGLKSAAVPFEFGISYAETLRLWKENFLKAWENRSLPTVDERFVNLWRFYLAYCEGAFRAERINVGHFSLEKPR